MTVTPTGQCRQTTGNNPPAADPLREVLLPRLEGVKPNAGGYMARCPAHEDGTASLSIGPGRHQPVVLSCHAGCDTADILDRIGVTWTELLNPDRPTRAADDTWMPCGHTKVAEYEYRDGANALVFAVARCSEKGKTCQGFRQWRPDLDSKTGKRWSLKLADGSKVGEGLPYRLPDLLAADHDDVVYVVEGEKDADLLWSMGLPATCNAGGAGKWTAAHAAHLAGRDVIVIADRDGPGEKHAVTVVNTLTATEPPVGLIEIAQADTGKDVSDHFAARGNIGSLVRVHSVQRSRGEDA